MQWETCVNSVQLVNSDKNDGSFAQPHDQEVVISLPVALIPDILAVRGTLRSPGATQITVVVELRLILKIIILTVSLTEDLTVPTGRLYRAQRHTCDLL